MPVVLERLVQHVETYGEVGVSEVGGVVRWGVVRWGLVWWGVVRWGCSEVGKHVVRWGSM